MAAPAVVPVPDPGADWAASEVVAGVSDMKSCLLAAAGSGPARSGRCMPVPWDRHGCLLGGARPDERFWARRTALGAEVGSTGGASGGPGAVLRVPEGGPGERQGRGIVSPAGVLRVLGAAASHVSTHAGKRRSVRRSRLSWSCPGVVCQEV
ncbi:hypothetical protein Slala02_31650 [Streptomyces lavendulae subsp. lavendulae]|nr:hypothetical protein Slala01_34930 [Streptomyces lavendulae subsp. lavendulae]GLX27345.1 hypothetical protein Slala02_31650 [Streptomyces lavendulae subsp. lavendulae]